MSWWEVEHLPLPELELIVRMLNDERDKADKTQNNNLGQMVDQFKLVKKLRETGVLPEEKRTPAQKARAEKMRRIRERHPIVGPDQQKP